MDFIRNDPFSIRLFFSRIWKFILNKTKIFVQDKLTWGTLNDILFKHEKSVRTFFHLILFLLSFFCLLFSALVCIDSYYPYLSRSSRAENTLSGLYTFIFIVSIYKGVKNFNFCFFRFSCSLMLATPGFFFFNKENNLYYTSSAISLLAFLTSESICSISNLRKFYIALSIVFWLPGIFQNDFKFSNGIIDTSLPSRIFITCWLGSSVFFYVKGSYVKNNFYSCCLILILWLGINDTTDRLNILILVLVILQHLSKFLFNGNIEFLIFIFKIILNIIGVKVDFCSIYNKGIVKTKTIFTNRKEYLIFKGVFKKCENDENCKLLETENKDYYEIELNDRMIKELEMYDLPLKNNKILLKGEEKAKKLFYSIKNRIDFADPCLGISIWHCKGLKEILFGIDIKDYELVNLPYFIYLGAWRLEIPDFLKEINALFFLHQYRCFKKVYSDLSFILMKCPLSFKSKIGNKKYKNFISDIKKIDNLGFKVGIPEKKLSRAIDINWTKSQKIEIKYTKGQRIKIFNDEDGISELSKNILKMKFEENPKNDNENKTESSSSNRKGVSDLGLGNIKEMLYIESYYKIVKEEKIASFLVDDVKVIDLDPPTIIKKENTFIKKRKFKRFKILTKDKFKSKRYFKFKAQNRLDISSPESIESVLKRRRKKRKTCEFSIEGLISKDCISTLNKRRRIDDVIIKKESTIKFPRAKVDDFDYFLNDNLNSIKNEEGRKKYSEIARTLSNQNLARDVAENIGHRYHSIVKRSEELFRKFEKNKISREATELGLKGIKEEIDKIEIKKNIKKMLKIDEEDENEWHKILNRTKRIELDTTPEPIKTKNRFEVLMDLEENNKENINIIEKELLKLIDEKERINRDVLNRGSWIKNVNKKDTEKKSNTRFENRGGKGSKGLIFKGKFKKMKINNLFKKEIVKAVLNSESRNNLKITISLDENDTENKELLKAKEVITRSFWESIKSECRKLIKNIKNISMENRKSIKSMSVNDIPNDQKVINNHAYFLMEMNKGFYNPKRSKEEFIQSIKEYYEKIEEIEEKMNDIINC